ncbi:hypothetical protein DERF_008997 [Dermatophagoides farinae]|uniref:Uncharacterized protein n=1 Tax=Dermatophagoides farinae TaxID=6954 RepID=A0A922HX14_DERFA|nr:hypothetical protein DERF_008997 [Dermatophagoides farinae]
MCWSVNKNVFIIILDDNDNDDNESVIFTENFTDGIVSWGVITDEEESIMNYAEPEVSVVAKEDEPDNKQQPLEPKQEVEIEKDGHDQSESEQQKPTNDLKIVDKANEIVEVIESETSISESSSSTTTKATKEYGRSGTDDNDIKTCPELLESEMKKKSHDIPKKRVSFEIVDMDDNEEITSDTSLVNIDDEKMIVDYDSHSMPSSVESKDKQQDSDLDSTIIVIEEIQSNDSFQHQSTISESITKQETEIKPPSSSSLAKETEPSFFDCFEI